jgi:hypothetical protein
MHRSGTAIALAATILLTAGCDDGTPTSPSDGPVVFTAVLSAQNEVPPVSNEEAGARGSVTIRMDIQRDSASTVTGATASFSASLLGFPAGTTATLAHIHEGAAGVAGGVRVNTGLSPANPLSLADGTGVLSVEHIAVTAAVANGLLENPSRFYFNVHTPLNPGGAVRGQLVRQ